METAAVARGPLRVTVDEDGVTRVQERYLIAAPVAGRLLRVELRKGDAVAAGDVVARIAAAPLDARTVRQGQAGVAAAEAVWREAGAALAARQAELAQARRETRRMRVLQEAGAVSRQTLEPAETAERVAARAVTAAAARVRAAAADVEAARAAVTGADPAAPAVETVTEVRSPVRGRVLRVAQESETPVIRRWRCGWTCSPPTRCASARECRWWWKSGAAPTCWKGAYARSRRPRSPASRRWG